MTSADVIQQIEDHRVVAMLRFRDPAMMEPIFDALVEGGIRVIEFTLTIPDALDLIRRSVERAPPGVVVGAGSIVNREAAARCIDAGASFLVTPVVKEEVIREAKVAGRAAIPGALTPTEIQTAWEAGADMVKVFPAEFFGPEYLRAVRAPLPHLKLIPAGGVTTDNARGWLEAGAAAVGVGSALLDSAALQAGDFRAVRRSAERLLEAVHGSDGQRQDTETGGDPSAAGGPIGRGEEPPDG